MHEIKESKKNIGNNKMQHENERKEFKLFAKLYPNRKIQFKDGKYTKNFKAFLRNQIKEGKFVELFTEPKLIYNESTKRFITKSAYLTKKGAIRKKYKTEFYETPKGLKRYPESLDFQHLYGKVTKMLKSEKVPFTLKLDSAILGSVKSEFQFKNHFHFKMWHSNIKDDVETDSKNCEEWKNIMNENKIDVFKFSLPTVTYGGGNNKHGDKRKLKGPHYDFDLYSPVDNANNCGFKVIEYITNCKFKQYASQRRQMQIEKEVMLNEEQLNDLYIEKSNNTKTLIIIGLDFEEDINQDNYDYVLLHKNHYFVVKRADYKPMANKSTKRGELYWDIETRQNLKCISVIGSGKNKRQ